MKKILCLFLFLPVLLSAQPYKKTFNTLRTVAVSDSSQLTTALSNATAGDEIVLSDGNYNGIFLLNKAGTATNPIVVKALGHAILTGGFRVLAPHNYIWGVEIKGATTTTSQGIEFKCDQCGAINNVIHDINGQVGLGAWVEGSQIIYGNIIWTQKPNANNPHNVYTQNDFEKNGYKYFVSNVIGDSLSATAGSFNFHGYTEGGLVSGYHLLRNVFYNGRFLIGGWNKPHYEEVVEDNYFYNASVQFGYKRPITFKLLNNYIASAFSDQWHWGKDEPNQDFAYMRTKPTEVSGNTFIQQTGKHWVLTTSNTGQSAGAPKFRTEDISDNNRFVSNDGVFKGSLNVGGVFYADVNTLFNWRKWTLASGGKSFDINSTETKLVNEPNKVAFIGNEYDATRGFLVVYNWKGDTEVAFNRPGKFGVYKVKDPYGSPLVSGTDTVMIPLTGQFETFLIKDDPAPPAPVCDLDAIIQLNTEIDALLQKQKELLDVCKQKK